MEFSIGLSHERKIKGLKYYLKCYNVHSAFAIGDLLGECNQRLIANNSFQTFMLRRNSLLTVSMRASCRDLDNIFMYLFIIITTA